MCGICGIYDRKSPADATLAVGKKALSALAHRGPDDEGVYYNGHVFLGHKRLSIIDTSANGRQPMNSNNGRYICTFNGELYNYQQYRDLLISKGYSFKGHSDSEVIPNLFQEFGINFLDMIKGIFAIAIYDTQENTVLLIRDRLGVKPLYYHAKDGYLSFGSELKAILADERIIRKVDHQAIYDYLSFSYIPEPATGFQDIHSLLPGHYLLFNGVKASITQYYQPGEQANSTYAVPQEVEADLKKILADAVARQLMSDVPIGTFLSGGIDSSLVTAFSVAASKNPIESFTVKFPDQAFDESYYAKKMAEHCGSRYNELHIRPQAIDASLLKSVLEHFDQPFGDSSALPTYLISSMIREKITVALSGDGGDEFFSGYEVSWRYPFILKLKKIPVAVRQLIIAALMPLKFISATRYRQYKKLLQLSFLDEHIILQNTFAYLTEEEKHELYNTNFSVAGDIKPTHRLFKEIYEKDKPGDTVQRFYTRYSLPGDMLKKVDMMSMKAGIEVRVPLLYEDVVDYSYKIPEQLKFKFGKGKLVLRNILATMAPDEVVNKKKWGFSIPLDKSLSADGRSFIEQTLNKSDALLYTFIKKEVVQRWLNMFLSGNNDMLTISRSGLYQRIYMLLSLELWLQKYKPAIY